MICIGLFVMYCNMAQPKAIDGFCQVYQPIVVQKGDGTIAGKLAVKQRILANELTYRKVCK